MPRSVKAHGLLVGWTPSRRNWTGCYQRKFVKGQAVHLALAWNSPLWQEEFIRTGEVNDCEALCSSLGLSFRTQQVHQRRIQREQVLHSEGTSCETQPPGKVTDRVGGWVGLGLARRRPFSVAVLRIGT